MIITRYAINYCFIVIILSLLSTNRAFGLKMKGKVYDFNTNQPLENVSIFNTFTQKYFLTDSTGDFSMDVEHGHLIEFQKLGYKVVRVRISGYEELPYYSIAMRIGAFELEEVEIKGRNYRMDSIIDRETYRWAIEHYKLEGIDMIIHPFDALSKRNRQIWAFQKHFEYFEKQKFIDYVFNNHLISKITGMDSANIEIYKKAYRPSYDQIKAWTEYEFYEYIKTTGAHYLRKRRK